RRRRVQRGVMPIPRRTFLAFLLGCAAGLRPALAGSPGPTQWAEDFEAMWRAIDRRYAFMEAKRGSWARVRRQWAPRAARARSRPEFVAVIEGALEELRDDHVAISERTATSPRRIPADTD